MHEPTAIFSNGRGSHCIRCFCQARRGQLQRRRGRYVILPDHVHLFVRGGGNFRLGPWIGTLRQALAKAGMLSRGKGQIWEEEFFDHVLRSNKSYSQKWNYVRENPARAGLVKSAADWPYQGEIVYIDRA